MSATEKYIILKLDEASAEATGQPTVWVQVAEIDADELDFASPSRVLGEWLKRPEQQATSAGTYLVARIEEDGYRVGRFTVTPRVEFDVAAVTEEKADGGLEVVA